VTSTDLPWTILGRKVRPYALAVSLASLCVALTLLARGQDAGAALDGRTGPAIAIGAMAFIAFALLMGGWWLRGERMMRWGLLASAGVSGARAGFIFLSTSDVFAVSAWLSACWVVASGGAYLLEASSRGYER